MHLFFFARTYFLPCYAPIFFCVIMHFNFFAAHLPCCALIFLRTYPAVPLFFYALTLLRTYPLYALPLTLLCPFFFFFCFFPFFPFKFFFSSLSLCGPIFFFFFFFAAHLPCCAPFFVEHRF